MLLVDFWCSLPLAPEQELQKWSTLSRITTLRKTHVIFLIFGVVYFFIYWYRLPLIGIMKAMISMKKIAIEIFLGRLRMSSWDKKGGNAIMEDCTSNRNLFKFSWHGTIFAPLSHTESLVYCAHRILLADKDEVLTEAKNINSRVE